MPGSPPAIQAKAAYCIGRGTGSPDRLLSAWGEPSNSGYQRCVGRETEAEWGDQAWAQSWRRCRCFVSTEPQSGKNTVPEPDAVMAVKQRTRAECHGAVHLKWLT